MEIACPNCAKRFRVPAEKLGSKGRRVRCATCRHLWFQPPGDDEPEPPARGEPAALPPPPGAPRAVPPLYDRPPIFDGPRAGDPRRLDLSREPDYSELAPPRSRTGIVIGWVLLVLVVVALVAGGWYYRNQIVATVPQLQQIYDLVGVPLEETHPGVVLRDITTRLNTVDDQRVMTVTGSVVNVTDQLREVPMLVATVTDKTGAVLVEWRFDAGQAVIPPGQSVPFETRREAIPRGDLSVRVDFILP